MLTDEQLLIVSNLIRDRISILESEIGYERYSRDENDEMEEELDTLETALAVLENDREASVRGRN